MDCKEFEKRIPDFIHKKMSYITTKRFTAHLKECPSCREELNIQYLIDEGLIRLEEGSAFDLQKEIREILGEADRKVRFHDKLIKAGGFVELFAMFLIAAAVLTIILL